MVSNWTPGQRDSSDRTTSGTIRWRRTGLLAQLAVIVTELVEGDHVLDQALESLRLGRDVDEDLVPGGGVEGGIRAGERLGAAVDRGERRPQLVRQHADEGLAHALPLPGRRDVAQDDDGLRPRGAVVSRHVDGIRRHLDPASGRVAGLEGDGPGVPAERRREVLRVVELSEDLRVGALVHVREEVLARRVGKRDPAVGGAHDDAVAHGPDDGIELGGAGVLRLGEHPQPDRRCRPGRPGRA